MPPRRANRASSVEDNGAQATQAPTRTSRRLRSTPDSNSSPLRALSPPRRRRNATKTTTPEAESSSTLYTASLAETEDAKNVNAKRESAKTESEKESVEKDPAEAESVGNEPVRSEAATSESTESESDARDKETAAGVPEPAYVPPWVRVVTEPRLTKYESEALAHLEKFENYSAARKVFTQPMSFREFRSMFEGLQHSSFDLSCSSRLKAELKEVAMKLTESDKVDLMIEQRAGIAERDEKYRASQRELARVEQEKEELEEAMLRDKQEREQEKELLRSNSKKRSAPTEDVTDSSSEEHPARRRKVTTSGSEIQSGELATNDMVAHARSPAGSSQAGRRGSDESAANGSGSLLASEDVRDSPTDSKYRRFVKQRERERLLEERRQNWLGAAFTNLNDDDDDLFPQQNDSVDDLDNDGAESQSGSDRAAGQDRSHVQVASHQNSNSSFSSHNLHDNTSSSSPRTPSQENIEPSSTALTPIPEESEPQTPTSSRWGLRSILAPVSRLFGVTPRTEPARRVAPPPAAGISAPTSTPASAPSVQRPLSESPIPNRALPASIEDQPTTPPRDFGITRASFIPQSAPQPRTAQTPRRRKTHAERIKAFDASQAKRKEAEEKARRAAMQEEERRRQEAENAENDRLRAEALECRRLSVLAMQQTGQKRKIRVDDLEVIPNPAPGTYGMNEKYFEEDSDGEVYIDEDVSMMDAFTPPPAKKVRFEEPPPSDRPSQKKPWWQTETFNNVSPHIKNPSTSPSSDPHRAQPYTGTMFADTRSEPTYSGGNVFDKAQSREEKKTMEESLMMSPISYGRKHHVWTAPKSPPKVRPPGFNYEGHFEVPDDSDSESEFEQSDQAESPTPAQKLAAEKRAKSRENAQSKKKEIGDAGAVEVDDTEKEPEARTNIFTSQIEQSEPKSDSPSEGAFTQQPPPPPTPAHAALPGTPTAASISQSQSDSDALAKARLQAEKYKPKTPSGLRATSRLSSSPVISQEQRNRQAALAGDANINSDGDEEANVEQVAATQPPTTITNMFQPSAGLYSNVIAQPTADNLSYEQTIQYAIDLAKAVPQDQVPISAFVWPKPTPAPWPLDPEVEAALKDAENHPDWDAYCDQTWSNAWNTYLKEKAEGMHGGLSPAPLTA